MLARVCIPLPRIGFYKTQISSYRIWHGGRFIWDDGTLRINVVKDKDVVRDVAETGCIGFVGSDVTTEQCLEQVSVEALCNVGVLRYGLLARPAMADVVATKLANQEQLVVGTSYAVATKAILGDMVTIGIERSGAIEGLPERFPWLDGVVELLESGNSAVTNELVIVVNNLRNVELMLVTRPGY